MQLTLEPLAEALGGSDLPGGLSESYTEFVNRLCRSAARRCRDSFRLQALPELQTQLGIRALSYSDKYIRGELSALRKLRSLIDSRRKFGRDAGTEITPEDSVWDLPAARPWFRSATWSDVEKFFSFVAGASRRKLCNLGVKIIDGLVADRQAQGDFRAPGDIWASLASRTGRVSFKTRAGSRKDNFQPVTAMHMDEIENHLPPGTPEEGLLSLRVNGGKQSDAGITRLLARTAWLTGARGCEMFSLRILEPDPDTCLTDDHVMEAYRDPVGAIADNLLKDMDQTSMRKAREAQGESRSFRTLSGTPPILVIRTAKTATSSPKIDNTLRAQVLEGVSWEDFHVLWLASRLATPQYNHVSARSVCRRVSAILNRAAEEALPFRRQPITLHVLRHAFAHVARRSMRPTAVAALMGHTSLVTTRGYGGNYARYSSQYRSSRWMPEPDAARVLQNQIAWKPAPTPDPEPVQGFLRPPELLAT